MSGYGEPDWINPQTDVKATTTEENNVGESITAPSPQSSANAGSAGKGGWVLCLISLFNIGLSAMMATLGVLTLIEVHKRGFGDFSEPFLASYMIMFALLLFVYEFMWWSPVPSVNKGLRRNFGFLYGMRGKGLYLIFVGCLCLGLGRDASVKELNYATGSAFLFGGLLHYFVICFHAELALTYQAPTAGILSGTSDENVV